MVLVNNVQKQIVHLKVSLGSMANLILPVWDSNPVPLDFKMRTVHNIRVTRTFQTKLETFRSQKVHEFNEVLYGKDEVLHG